MCTQIATKTKVAGSAQGARGWVPLDEAIVTCDHAAHAWVDHALRIDLTTKGTDHLAVELDLPSARALVARLTEVLAEAERAGVS